MKKMYILLIALIIPQVMNAQIEINGIYYDFNWSTLEATVSGNESHSYSGDITIPASVESWGVTFKVTAINFAAFNSCPSLTSVTIEEGITTIGHNAFSYSKKLEKVYLPNSVTSIEGCIFMGCDKLTDIHLPENITEIPMSTFSECISLTTISIPGNVTTIGESAFANCNNLKTIAGLDKVKHIESNAFAGCVSLKSADFSSIVSIGNRAFDGCSSLTSILIPSTCIEIAGGAFAGCTGIIWLSVDKNNTRYDSRDNSPVIVETISNTLVVGCKYTGYGSIPQSVTKIGDRAFEGMGLSGISIPDGVTCIGDQAFYGNDEVTKVIIPASVESIGMMAFGTNISSIIVEKENKIYDSRENCNAIVEKATNKLISGCMNSKIPESITAIDAHAFQECFGLSSINIPGNVTSIGESAFARCNLETVFMEEGVISIGRGAFWQCGILATVSIPNTVKSIGDYAFAMCFNLNDMFCYAKDLPSTGEFPFADAFSNKRKSATLHVPAVALEAYKSTEPWNSFPNIVTIEGGSTDVIKVSVSDDLQKVIDLAKNGDVLILEDNGIYEQLISDGNGAVISGSLKVSKDIAITAANHATIKGRFDIYDGASLKVTNLTIDGNNSTRDQIFNYKLESAPEGTKFGALDVENCTITGKQDGKGLVYVNVNCIVESIIFNNCFNYGIYCSGGDFIDCRRASIGELRLTNSTFYNVAVTRDFIRIDDNSSEFEGEPGPKITVDHCTLVNVGHGEGNAQPNYRMFYVRYSGNKITFTNNLVVGTVYRRGFANKSNTDNEPTLYNNAYFECENLTCPGLNADNNILWFDYIDGVTFELSDSPFKNDAPDFTLSPSSRAYLEGIGDPRWIITSDVNPEITPITDSEEISFSKNIDEDTGLSNTVINNTYYNMDAAGGDGYDATEQALVLNSTTTTEQMTAIQNAKVGDAVVRENYTGIIFEIPAGKGTIIVDAKTVGTHVLNVQIGNGVPTKITKTERGTADVEYNVNVPTYVYLYASTDASVNRAPSVAANSVLLYGYKVTLGAGAIPGDANGDGNVNVTDIVEIVNDILGHPSAKFDPIAADVNGDGVVNVTDIVSVVNIILSSD